MSTASADARQLALSTHWNAGRHDDGEAMLNEILALGLTRVELGYNLHSYHVPGVQRLVAAGTVTITSVHNFCPVPAGSAIGHPELYTLADPQPRTRAQALTHTLATVRFAASLGARFVVVHGGNVAMRSWLGGYTSRLKQLITQRKRFTEGYERLKLKAILVRERRAGPFLDRLSQGLDQLLPEAAACGVRVALENLPSWEALPTETELLTLQRRFGADLGYWHDTGHAAIREQLGFTGQLAALGKLSPMLAGLHVHDMAPPLQDHTMPPRGQLDFGEFLPYLRPAQPLVLEPAPNAPAEHLRDALAHLRTVWPSPAAEG